MATKRNEIRRSAKKHHSNTLVSKFGAKRSNVKNLTFARNAEREITQSEEDKWLQCHAVSFTGIKASPLDLCFPLAGSIVVNTILPPAVCVAAKPPLRCKGTVLDIYPLTSPIILHKLGEDDNQVMINLLLQEKEGEMGKIEKLKGKQLKTAELQGELAHNISLITRVMIKGYNKVIGKTFEEKDIDFLQKLEGMDSKSLEEYSRKLEQQLSLLR